MDMELESKLQTGTGHWYISLITVGLATEKGVMDF